MTSGSEHAGVDVEHIGSVVELADCACEQDRCGCEVSFRGNLVATRVDMSSSECITFSVYQQGKMMFHGCSAKECGSFRLHAGDVGSKHM